MRQKLVPFAAVLVTAWYAAVPAAVFADGLRDNDPAKVRPVPAVGIKVSEESRKDLQGGIASLAKFLSSLRPKGSPDAPDADLQAWDRYADVAIFHRAAKVALDHQEFFNEKEIPAARKLLVAGLERAGAALHGESPWLEKTGLVVRGYMSRIDGTPQPYGLLIPDSYSFFKPQPIRLDVWLHGRGETLSEVNFLTQRMKDARPIAPGDTIVLHPYGRFCNANKFAGEVDTLEALAAVRRTYAIHPDLIAVRGFSMGGAACWQFAVHHPALWFAATPGAGFSETPEFLKSFQKETLNPPWWEEKLWRWYDCPGYVTNLKNLPVIAYSGEEDIQKQAADVMEAAYAKAGMKLLHLIGPKTKHSIHPDSAKEMDTRLAKLAADVYSAPDSSRILPNHLEFTTFTLVYPAAGWVTLHGMHEQWERATVTLDHQAGMNFRVTTNNVTAMTLHMAKLVKQDLPAEIVIDGQQVPLEHRGEKSVPVNLVLADGKWKLSPPPDREQQLPLHKRPATCGPIDHAFMSSFVFVKPTGKYAHPAVQNWVDAELQRAITQWRRQFRGDARVKLDSEVTAEDIANSNLVLWGDPQSNALLGKLAGSLPIKWAGSTITAGNQKFDAARHTLIAIYPNPQNSRKYIVLNSGFTYREYDYLNNARQTPKLPDWAIVDLRTPPGTKWPGKIVAADFFDKAWQLKPVRAGTASR